MFRLFLSKAEKEKSLLRKLSDSLNAKKASMGVCYNALDRKPLDASRATFQRISFKGGRG